MRQQLEYCIQFWAAQNKTDIDKLESKVECHHNGQAAGAHDVRGDAETAGFVKWEEEKAKPRERQAK